MKKRLKNYCWSHPSGIEADPRKEKRTEKNKKKTDMVVSDPFFSLGKFQIVTDNRFGYTCCHNSLSGLRMGIQAREAIETIGWRGPNP